MRLLASISALLQRQVETRIRTIANLSLDSIASINGQDCSLFRMQVCPDLLRNSLVGAVERVVVCDQEAFSSAPSPRRRRLRQTGGLCRHDSLLLFLKNNVKRHVHSQ
jgi:hypothetical protein